jgi:asparagine synthase (glutamine-hydrolysing)
VLRGKTGKLGHQLRKLSEILQFTNDAEMYQYLVGTIGPLRLDRLARLVAAPVGTGHGPFFDVMKELRGLSARDRITQVFIRTFLVDTVLAKTDRAGMAFGLEARVPFLDDEMVAFSARLPFRYKTRAGSSKHLLRRLLARKLAQVGIPPDLSMRPKQGFSVPMREWLRGELKYLVDEYLFPERLKREGLFAPRAVHELVLEHLDNRANHSHLLWSLISFQMWKERYLA